ncbi:DNA-binding GntR family transcriptional regulator [Amycolatopsis lexingtonensis]|uniref:DNA-binding GntR family transcriptional regulator n=1 Tax=Amycolatopsis lexingtonensis TaxID=218822 RepID=A0ABR9IHK2_9PSEU|nr:winged helix-turn-helix domain-containing protein [Amycolatopsis lexingtonensis]MBE1502658.1 DNA-binding GntR family transcriptional regulator [Amycolatopsis lexingtonensis]
MDSSAGQAPFEVVAATIRKDMLEGRLKAGDKLPTHRDLASKYEVAVATIQRALKVLQDEGRLVARQSIGVFVTEAAKQAEPLTLARLAAELAALRERVEALEHRPSRP